MCFENANLHQHFIKFVRNEIDYKIQTIRGFLF